MQRKQSFINDKRRVSYLAAVYNRIYRGQSVLIEGEYGVGKNRFLELLNPKKLQGVWVESLFNVHEILASILQGMNYEAVATYRRTPHHLKMIRNLEDFILEYKDFESEAIEQIYVATRGDMIKFKEICTDCRDMAKELGHSFVDLNLVVDFLANLHPMLAPKNPLPSLCGEPAFFQDLSIRHLTFC
jgi:hypothetical protein